MIIFFVGIFVVFLCLVGISVYSNQTFTLVHYEFGTGKNETRFHTASGNGKTSKEDVKAVYLTDLHGQSYGNHNQKLLAAIQEQNPDMIFVGGDMMVKEPTPDFSVVLALIKELVKIAPVYYANGNHEKKIMDYWEESKDAFLLYKEEMESLGVRYLINDTVAVECKGKKFEITGLDLGLQHYRKFWHKPTLSVEELKRMIPDRKHGDVFRILLAHNPQYFELYAKFDIDLVLSGHVHGGIMILPWLGGVIAPNLRLFPKYDSGEFNESGTRMILSRGLGTHSIRFRIFNIPEVSVIHF